MNDKKTQKLLADPQQWELDLDLIKLNDLTMEQVIANPEISRRFIFTKESLKLRAFGDVFASFNQKAYEEVVDFERLFVKSLIENWKEMSQKSIDLITRKHMFWAELMSSFADCEREIDKEIARNKSPSEAERLMPSGQSGLARTPSEHKRHMV